MCLKSQRLNQIDYAAFKKEIGAIEIHDLEDYFLDMYNNNIKITSNNNSIVAYLIGITDIKPTKPMIYKGGSVPDIDSDISGFKRDKAIDYLKNKYGYNKVSMIGTYGKMFAKTAIRLVGKALGYEVSLINQVAEMVPPPDQGKNWTVSEAIDINPDLQALQKKNKEAADILLWADKLSGTLSHRSVHAAGVIVSDENINDVAPTWEKDGISILEYDGNEAEKYGFLKIDLLGLKTLDIIDDTIELINEKYNLNLNARDIPLEDDKSFELIDSGNLLGVFQIEGQGISRFAKRLKPRKFEDVAFILAGYRPGPMQFLPSVLAIKNNSTPFIESHSSRFPILKDILSETYEFFIYQEQIIEVAKKIAGYNDQEANDLLNIIRKKKRELIPKEKKRFFPKAKEQGLTDDQVEMLWSDMEDFASYSFNKSHAVSYAFLTMQTAWLKAYYPAEFYVANIKHELSSIDKVIELIDEAKQCGIYVTPPDINTSYSNFTVLDKNTIKYGLAGIIGLGSSAAEFIINDRNENGPYSSLTDFISRTNPRSNVAINLIKAGAFDKFANRSQYLYETGNEKHPLVVNQILDTVKYYKDKGYHYNLIINKNKEIIELPSLLEYDIVTLISMEKEVTNLWLSSNPYQIYSSEIAAYKNNNPEAHLGIVREYMPFKTATGFAFTMGSNKYFVFERTFNRLRLAKPSDLKGKLMIVHQKPFKEEGTYVVEELFSFYDKIKTFASNYSIDITLDNDGLKIIDSFKYIKLSTQKTTNRYLALNFAGESYYTSHPAGYF